MKKNIAGFIQNIYDNLFNNLYPIQRSDVADMRLDLVVSVTTRCNLKCVHCMRNLIDDNKKISEDLPVPAFESFLKGAKKLNAQEVYFTGGEPILHPDFRTLVDVAVKQGYNYGIGTNGWIHNEYLNIIKSSRHHFLYFKISIDGATEDVHDAIRNKPGSFKRVIESINFYKKNGIEIMPVVCLSKINYHQLEKILDLCTSFDIKTIRWISYVPLDENDENALTYEERLEASKKILSHRITAGRGFVRSHFSSSWKMDNIHFKNIAGSGAVDFCPVLNGSHLFLNHEGAMLFCCDSNKKLKNKPYIQKDGFEKCLKITLNTMNNIKKIRLEKIIHGEETGRAYAVFAINIQKNVWKEPWRNWIKNICYI